MIHSSSDNEVKSPPASGTKEGFLVSTPTLSESLTKTSMERVQYSLEASLPELKDLQTNGIFSPLEIKEIIKRRTNYELQLIRRQPRKKDFLDYIEYEMALERLRRKRVSRLGTFSIPLPKLWLLIWSHRYTPSAFSIKPFAGSKAVFNI